MTTLRDVRRLVEPLLEQSDELVLAGRGLYLCTQGHLIRGIFIDRMSAKDGFDPLRFVMPCFEGFDHLTFNWSAPLYYPGPQFPMGDPRNEAFRWKTGNPRAPEALARLAIDDVLPKLRSIRTLDDFAVFANAEAPFFMPLDSYAQRKMVVDAARGRLDEARAACAHVRLLAEHTARERRPSAMTLRVASELVPLVEADDREGMARLLWRWEAAFIERFGLEKIWVKEPFPLEVQNGLSVWKEFL